MCSKKVLPLTSKSGFGFSSVSSPIRFPFPAAKMTAFIYVYENTNCTNIRMATNNTNNLRTYQHSLPRTELCSGTRGQVCKDVLLVMWYEYEKTKNNQGNMHNTYFVFSTDSHFPSAFLSFG